MRERTLACPSKFQLGGLSLSSTLEPVKCQALNKYTPALNTCSRPPTEAGLRRPGSTDDTARGTSGLPSVANSCLTTTPGRLESDSHSPATLRKVMWGLTLPPFTNQAPRPTPSLEASVCILLPLQEAAPVGRTGQAAHVLRRGSCSHRAWVWGGRSQDRKASTGESLPPPLSTPQGPQKSQSCTEGAMPLCRHSLKVHIRGRYTRCHVNFLDCDDWELSFPSTQLPRPMRSWEQKIPQRSHCQNPF